MLIAPPILPYQLARSLTLLAPTLASSLSLFLYSPASASVSPPCFYDFLTGLVFLCAFIYTLSFTYVQPIYLSIDLSLVTPTAPARLPGCPSVRARTVWVTSRSISGSSADPPTCLDRVRSRVIWDGR